MYGYQLIHLLLHGHTHRHPNRQDNQQDNVAPVPWHLHQSKSNHRVHEIIHGIPYHTLSNQRALAPCWGYGVRIYR